MHRNNRLRLGMAAAVAILWAGPSLAQDASATSASTAPGDNAPGDNAPEAARQLAVVSGKGVVVISDTLLAMQLNQHPNSYTGGFITVTVPIGEVIRDQGLAMLKPRFSDGVETANAAQPGAYNIAMRLDGFEFKYDGLVNLGMAVTPEVTITVTADVTRPDGTLLLHKAYNRTKFKGGSYFASLKPRERVITTLGNALGQIYNDIARDIANDTPPAATPVAAPAANSSVSTGAQ